MMKRSGFNPLFAGLTLKVRIDHETLKLIAEGFNPLFAGLTLKVNTTSP